MHPILNIAVQAAREAGRIILHAMDRVSRQDKLDRSLMRVDQQAEQAAMRVILKAYPDHVVLGESNNHSLELKTDDFTWIVYGLDSKVNYFRQFPHYAISIAFKDKKRFQHAVIYDPLQEELFTASYGQGAQMNRRRIRVNQTKMFNHLVVATQLPTGNVPYFVRQMSILEKLLPKIYDIRQSGSVALDFAYVANGRLDAFWSFGLNVRDIAAGVLLVQEAGGLVSDFEGKENYVKNNEIIVASFPILKSFLSFIRL